MVSMPSLRAACVQVQRSLHAHRYGHRCSNLPIGDASQ